MVVTVVEDQRKNKANDKNEQRYFLNQLFIDINTGHLYYQEMNIRV